MVVAARAATTSDTAATRVASSDGSEGVAPLPQYVQSRLRLLLAANIDKQV